MRTCAKSMATWVKACLGVVPLLLLTSCKIANLNGLVFKNLDRGANPHSSAVFCDIENTDADKVRRCATDEDKAMGVRLAAAAVALNTGQTSEIGLDESPEARARCGGEPEAVFFRGPFPEGAPVCLNCGVIGPAPAKYQTPTAMCAIRCLDVSGQYDGEPEIPAVREIFSTRSRASTNWESIDRCLLDVCPAGDMLSPAFADPRRLPEAVVWGDLIGVSATANSIRKIAGAANVFDAGAASTQRIARGDAYVEFSASEEPVARHRVLGDLCHLPVALRRHGPQPPGHRVRDQPESRRPLLRHRERRAGHGPGHERIVRHVRRGRTLQGLRARQLGRHGGGHVHTHHRDVRPRSAVQ